MQPICRLLAEEENIIFGEMSIITIGAISVWLGGATQTYLVVFQSRVL